jgi:hypothetical protein
MGVRFRAVLVLAILGSLLSACAPAEPPAEHVGTLDVDPDSALGLPKVLGLEPIVRDETQVLSEAEANALTSLTIVNPDECAADAPTRVPCEFVLVFATLPADLAMGSVIAAGVTEATPAGLLVTVASIDGLTVEATEATLLDALEQGDGVVEQTFTQKDVASVELAPGVSAIGTGVAHRTGSSSSVGEALAFNYNLENVEIADGVFADGSISFDIGCGAYAGLTWETAFGVPIYPNGAYFEAKCGASQSGSVAVRATESVDVNDSTEVAAIDLDPITFFIGPVPIVLLPSVVVSVSANGRVIADMSFGAAEYFSATVGINYSDGFHAIKDFGSDFTSNVSVTGRMSADAGITVGESLMLYGIAGPTMSETLYLNLKGAAPGESPIWCIRGGLRAEASLSLDLGIENLVWGPEELFDTSKELACAENTAPKLTIISPSDGDTIYPNAGVFPPEFTAYADDPEDGSLTVHWTSNKDGDLGTGKLVDPPLSLGSHVITATVTDANGVEVSKSISIEVKESVPEVSFQLKDANGVWQPMTSLSGAQGDVVYFRVVSKHDVALVDESCFDVSWTSSLLVSPVSQCDYRVTLSKKGSFTVTSTVTDKQGKSGSASFAVTVAAPPAVIAPQMSAIIATKTAPSPSKTLFDGADIDPGSTVSLKVEYLNEPAAKVTVRYEWWVKSATGNWTLISGTDGIPSTGSYREWIAPASGGSFTFKANMINKATGTVIATSSYLITVPTPIK